ncbi:MAG: MATE family efflux transporter [Ignavibacteria bacterium GWB2_35_12]|nr:MAG: MATE family efflux transporter [Ignavibacteria bacterium GWA2_35_8]OGU42498.1 MAG: MATE family efflux transporter [Ignavibacteria bacterium GWB2_35_12]OGU96644.1 MAG: MATE family efflux transporter [Ignavibacteria bacterium RIFOXYA2_FULL_35_10]OGV24278.1 MAG: MATE family efflux transporter [Ignavibacteria bacterium RIFOXYC2_FULL_35_21]
MNFSELKINFSEAVKGTDRDYTSGSLRKAIILLSIPMVLEMVFESIFAVVDIYFVSKIGANAVAFVGITESMLTIVYSLAWGLSTATSAVVSRRIGEKNTIAASNAAFQAILTGLGLSLFIAIPGFIFASDMLKIMGLSAKIASEYSGYTAIMLGANSVIMLLFVINAVFRSAGDAAVSMKVLWLANIINIILDPCLIFGLGPFPELGIKGAAIATTTGRSVAVVLQIYILFYGNKRVKFKLSDLKPDLKVIKDIIILSLGTVGQNIIATSSWIGLVRIVSAFGSEVVAGYTIAIRIIIFSLLPSWGISNAASTLVGQNLGAKKPERAEESVWVTAKANAILMAVIGFVFVLIPESLVSLLTSDIGVIQKGGEALRIISYGFIAYGPGMVLVHSINGAGDTNTPTKINIFCYWLLEIPLAYLLAMSLNLGEQGVFYAIVISEIAMTVTAGLVFRKGKWKERVV